MNKKSRIISWLTIGLALLLLACQSFGFGTGASSQNAPATPKSWPHSTFVPPQQRTQVAVGQELVIESHHASTEQLDTVQIFVNGQPLTTEAGSAAGQTNTFPNDLANVRLVTQEGEATAGSVDPVRPAYSKTVQVVWLGHVPGVYELSLTATDAAGRIGNTIVQRIEVK